MAVTKLSNSGIATGGVLKYDSMLAGNSAYVPPSFESIATVTVSSNVTSIEFTSIPQTFTHLQIRYIARTNRSLYTDDVMGIQLNGDTSGLYNFHVLDGTGSAIEASASASGQTLPRIARVSGSTAPTNTFAPGIIEILDYKDTNKNRVVTCIGGNDTNSTSGTVSVFSALYRSTTAVSSIKLQVVITESQFNFVAKSTFALYGIRSA